MLPYRRGLEWNGADSCTEEGLDWIGVSCWRVGVDTAEGRGRDTEKNARERKESRQRGVTKGRG